jgi:hypothetical protein
MLIAGYFGKRGKSMNETAIVPIEVIENRIYLIRGQKVMIDRDLAELFNVKTKNMNTQVKRNIERFPEEFIFRLTEQEKDELAANCSRFNTLKHSTSLPIAFTEHGIAMLATVLKSEKAAKMSIIIIKTFIRLRYAMAMHKDLAHKIDLLEKRVFKHDANIRELVRDIRKMTIDKSSKKLNVGFLK